jgi:hypothetical protein
MYLLYGCHIQKIRYHIFSFTSFDQATFKLILIYKTPNSEDGKSNRFSSLGKILVIFSAWKVGFSGHRNGCFSPILV